MYICKCARVALQWQRNEPHAEKNWKRNKLPRKIQLTHAARSVQNACTQEKHTADTGQARTGGKGCVLVSVRVGFHLYLFTLSHAARDLKCYFRRNEKDFTSSGSWLFSSWMATDISDIASASTGRYFRALQGVKYGMLDELLRRIWSMSVTESSARPPMVWERNWSDGGMPLFHTCETRAEGVPVTNRKSQVSTAAGWDFSRIFLASFSGSTGGGRRNAV